MTIHAMYFQLVLGVVSYVTDDWNWMNRNHSVVDKMMTYCGFKDGAGWANNLLIDTALSNGAYGAKLTGAGGGGSVFAISHPDNIAKLRSAWNESSSNAGLNQARVYQPRIDRKGLVVERISAA